MAGFGRNPFGTSPFGDPATLTVFFDFSQLGLTVTQIMTGDVSIGTGSLG